MNSPRTPLATAPVIVVADDLIWSSRLRAAVERASTTAVAVRSAKELSEALGAAPDGAVVIIDLNGRAYDGVEAVRESSTSGRRVLVVGQHEDLGLRKRALDAGAVRVLSYNKLFSDGPAVVAKLLEGSL